MTLDGEDSCWFFIPVLRKFGTTEVVVFPVGRPAFLQAAEEVILLLKHPVTGQAWEYDGYRRTRLFLVQPHHQALGIPEFTVEFGLQFGDRQTTVAIHSPNPAVQQLFHQFTSQLASRLLEQKSRI